MLKCFAELGIRQEKESGDNIQGQVRVVQIGKQLRQHMLLYLDLYMANLAIIYLVFTVQG